MTIFPDPEELGTRWVFSEGAGEPSFVGDVQDDGNKSKADPLDEVGSGHFLSG